MAGDPGDEALLDALLLSQRLGMLGSRPIPEVIDHSMAFVAALRDVAAGRTVVDLGSGGGVPGLVVARRRPDLDVVLVERRVTRADHLQRLIRRLGVQRHVRVAAVDASELRGSVAAAAVTARSFGPPAAVLAAAVPLLAIDGLVVVAEPPGDPLRWTPNVLGDFALVRHSSADRRVAVLGRDRSIDPRDVPRGTCR